MKKLTILLCFVAFMAVAAGGPAGADENDALSPLAVKTKNIVDEAYDFVSRHSGNMAAVQKALVTDPRFFDRENSLYVFVHCYDASKKEAIVCGQGARPELLGKNMWHLRTPNGRLLFHEIMNLVERDGEGWLEYDWLNPFTKSIQTKRSYVKKIVLEDGREAWVGCGYWKERPGL